MAGGTLQRRMSNVIPMADIYRKGPSAIRSAGTARKVLHVLVQHGWVSPAEHPTAKEAFQLVAV